MIFHIHVVPIQKSAVNSTSNEEQRHYQLVRGVLILCLSLKKMFKKGKTQFKSDVFVFINLFLRAQLLLDQYRKTAQLYQTNVLFIPLGDDFRYSTMLEAERQFDNFDVLIKYINERTDWNTDVRL